ncbi:hypothetical protein MRB53_033369 [Persea americana]|uniref:Uncharacterized protein n=1 Tax=Persea americana TaxID=3435 RepID=A0ACC2KVN4_PERAE|nr:hypothetical protein MRB53_033369 [Persea americana]
MFPKGEIDYIRVSSTVGRMLLMFLIGLELDIDYLQRTKFLSVAITVGGTFTCAILAAIFSYLLYWQTDAHGGLILFTIILTIILSSTASPILIRMAVELKVATEVGQIAISSALLNDLSCFFIIAIVDVGQVRSFLGGKLHKITKLVVSLFNVIVILVAVRMTRPLVRWLNRRYRQQRDLNFMELGAILSFVLSVAFLTYGSGYSSMIPCFIIGAVFPREGRAARTIFAKLTGPLHNVVLPLYIGSTGMLADIWVVWDSKHLLAATMLIVVLSTTAKVVGALLVARCFKLSIYQGLVLGLLLNVKGHVALLFLDNIATLGIWSPRTFNVVIVAVLLNTMLTGPVVSAILRRERKANAHYEHPGLEWQRPETELRMLACVHGPRDLPTIFNLVEASRGSDRSPLTAFFMHHVELTNTLPSHIFYHQTDEDDDDYGREDNQQVNDAIDAFAQESGIAVHQLTMVSAYSTMHQDICNGVEDVKASIVMIPFHRHQRMDGKILSGKAGHRVANKNVIRSVKCTVGILVDRGLGGTTQLSAMNVSTYHVVVLFFGGADDREALAYSGRLVEHCGISVTVVRFLAIRGRDQETGFGGESGEDDEALVSMAGHEKLNNCDDELFLSSFLNRYLKTGRMSYVERHVGNGAETVDAIRGMVMEGMFSLYIIGKGGHGLSHITKGISHWIEFPELGVIGDLLASSDFKITGSILVIQQYNPNKKGTLADEFAK